MSRRNFYYIFQRELSSEKGEHWQCYLEFNSQQYFKYLKKVFRNAHIEQRRESQAQAIKYCKKKQTRIGIPYEKGTPRAVSRTRVIKGLNKTKELAKKLNNKEIFSKILTKIKTNLYQNFSEIELEYPSYYWHNKNLLKDIWNEFNPINQLDIKPSLVIWCFGKSGTGKSIWTKKYLREGGWKDGEIASITPHNLTYSDKIYFDLSYEKCKVLIINEVDKNFPKHNNLITFIDRNALLITKGSHIRNNFELIIINSIYRPEIVFGYLGRSIATQVLRRIFNPLMDCQVYEVKRNEKQLQTVVANKLSFTDLEFQNWYQPELIRVPEPDYSLIEKE